MAPADQAALAELRLQFLTEALSLELISPQFHHTALLFVSSCQDPEQLSMRLGAACTAPLEGAPAGKGRELRGPAASKWRLAARAAAERIGRTCERGCRHARKGVGRFYTPRWVADEVARVVLRGVLDGRGLGAEAALSLRVLDPAAGAGAFLVAMVDAVADALGEGAGDNNVRRAFLSRCLRGFELDPLAAEASRLALWLVASRPGRPAFIPGGAVEVRDALLAPRGKGRYDIVVGNPPWGVRVSGRQTGKLGPAAAEALGSHRDSFVHFLALATESVCDGGAVGLVLPDALLWQVKYEAVRRYLLDRFRPMRVTLFGEALFAGATAPACALCLAERGIAPRRFAITDLRAGGHRPHGREVSWSSPADAPTKSSHHSLLPPPPWLDRLARRMQGKHATLAHLGDRFRFHDVGVNYATAALGEAILYEGRREHRADIPVIRGRDFAALTPPAGRARSNASRRAWLRHDWRRRVPAPAGVYVRAGIFHTAPKLLFRQTGDRPVATIDHKGVHFGRSAIAITASSEDELLWLAAVMNSGVFAALYRAVAPEAGRTFAQVKVSKLKLVPVPKVSGDTQLAKLARQLLTEASEKRRQELMAQVEEQAAKAYGLTPPERRRVLAFTASGGGERARRGRRGGKRSAPP